MGGYWSVRPHPMEIRENILAALAGGMSMRATARRYGVSHSTVRAYRDRFQQTGSAQPGQWAGRRVRIPTGDERLLRQMAAHPAASVREHCWWWQQTTGDPIGKGAMGRALQRHGYVQQPRPAPIVPKPHTERSRPHLPPRRPAMRRSYSTDLTDAEWTLLAPLVPPPRARGRPPRSRREILDAISYVVRTGCAWRLLPHDFPPCKTVYHYYRLWRLDGTWERIHDALREQVREQAGRQAQPTAGIIDSQSVRTTEKGGSGATTAGRR
jgi:transposase